MTRTSSTRYLSEVSVGLPHCIRGPGELELVRSDWSGYIPRRSRTAWSRPTRSRTWSTSGR